MHVFTTVITGVSFIARLKAIMHFFAKLIAGASFITRLKAIKEINATLFSTRKAHTFF